MFNSTDIKEVFRSWCDKWSNNHHLFNASIFNNCFIDILMAECATRATELITNCYALMHAMPQLHNFILIIAQFKALFKFDADVK